VSAPSPLHVRLREATREGHARLDGHPLLAPLGAEPLDALAYGDALVALHGLFAPLERALVAGGPLVDWRERRRVPALEADLAELGRRPLVRELDVRLPAELAPAIGVAYVVEGSSLGGQVIARKLARRPGASLPRRFFEGQGDAALPRFRALMALAEERCAPDAHTAAVGAAVALFDAMCAYLDEARALVVGR
jgi:heme oxygenase